MCCYNAFNVFFYRRELAPGTVSLTGDRAQGDDSKHWAYSSHSTVSGKASYETHVTQVWQHTSMKVTYKLSGVVTCSF